MANQGSLNKYTKISIYVNSQLLSQASNITIDRNPALQRVDTIELQFAGVSKGSAYMEISVDNAVPSADFEFDPGSFMLKGQPCEFTFFGAGKTLTTHGFIMSDNFSYAVNSASKLTFKATCRFEEWV